ncbi:hypothetical protein LEN26_009196 [Aphanomyces euteiches]|nr:hypothetical protein AeMF1_007377 [Aphanomyces euteiches]KAH9120497.1 hypothetical protein AeMF1_007382 [Aphanomyces euteiches]KAH9127794.1 hypothetical protein LEN26_009196 [Aphanomyces euteiches]KAH9193017.1 hypothetical protein AeNC1_005017 [Aphanomyces euteiches]
MRRNGFQVPFDIFQVTAWIAFPILVGGFYAFFVPFLAKSAAIATGVVYGISAIACVALAVITTSIDPSDRNVLNQVDLQHHQVTEDHLFCNVCTQYVDKKSRHCRICEKCVATFDHHCKWLNNCIGEHNYRYFFMLISAILVLTMVQFVVGIYLFVKAFSDSSSVLVHAASSYGCSGSQQVNADGLCESYAFNLTAIRAVVGVYLVILLPSFYHIGMLVLFHIRLYMLQTTTYDFIIQQRRTQLSQQEGEGDLFACNCRTAPTRPEETPAPALPKSSSTPMLSGFSRPSSIAVHDSSSHETKSPVSPSQREGYEPIETPAEAPTKKNAFFV